MGENLFLQILQVSVSMIPVILLLMLLGNRFQKRYVARWKYYIWLVLAVRLLVPWTPNFSVQPVEITLPVREELILEENFIEKVPEQVWDSEAPMATENTAILPEVEIIYEACKQDLSAPKDSRTLNVADLPSIAAGIWFIGMILYLSYHMLVNLLTGRKLRRWSFSADKILLEQIQDALVGDELPRHLEVLVNPQIAGPMVMGLWKPALFLPERSYKSEELQLILRHELTHYRRRDLWYKALLLLVNGVHWFNPFVYLMYREAERDLECSCDSMVMEEAGKATRCNYAYLILDTAAGKGMSIRLLTSNFHGGAKDMKKRLQNIMDTKRKRHGILTFLILVIISVGAGSLVGFKLGQKDVELETSEQREIASVQISQENPLPDRLAPDKELVGDKKFESPIAFLNEHMEQQVDKIANTTHVTLGQYDSTVSAYRKEGAMQTFYALEYGNNLYDDIHYEIKDGTLICEVGLYQGQTLYRGKAILTYMYENGEYVIDKERVELQLDWASDITARNSLWLHSQIMEEVDGLQLTKNSDSGDWLTLHRVVYGQYACNVLTVYLENGLIAEYKFPSNYPIMNDMSHIYHLPMQSDDYQTIILMLSDPFLQSTDESTDFYIFHVEVNEEGTQAEIVMDAVILDDGTDAENYEEYQETYLEMPFYHVISDNEAGIYYHEELEKVTLKVVGMPWERKVEQTCYVYWDGKEWKTYTE
ncbi:MAG: hypothetical protein IJ324_01925 [Lachnospiraceae bacterium]|nr:hypothetical protein [Lachnospiraceae bacterium]